MKILFQWGGWLEVRRLKLTSTKVEVEVEAELGNTLGYLLDLSWKYGMFHIALFSTTRTTTSFGSKFFLEIDLGGTLPTEPGSTVPQNNLQFWEPLFQFLFTFTNVMEWTLLTRNKVQNVLCLTVDWGVNVYSAFWRNGLNTFATLGSILDSQLNWESCKFQLASVQLVSNLS